MTRPSDPNKPLYQWCGYPPPGGVWLGGRCYEVVVPIDDIKMELERLRIRDAQRGSDLIYFGIIVAIACTVAHMCTSFKPLRTIAEWGIVGGVLGVVAGLLLKKIAEFENWILLGVCVVAAGALLYRFRDWSVSHLFKSIK